MSQTEDTLVSPPPPERVPAFPRPRLSRPALLALVGAVVVIAAVLIALASGAFGSSSPSSAGMADNAFPTSLATLTRRSLTQQTQVSATLGYAAPSTVVIPAGTAPANLTQAQQAATTAQSQLQTANTSLATDTLALDQANANVSANRAKLTVDCAGDNAGEAAAAGGAGGASGACATDSQAVTADEQSASQAAAKVASDRQQVASANAGLASADTALTQAESSATVYGQSSTYTELPAVGAIVRRGQTLFTISGEPVIVLYGAVAPWRAFMGGMSPGKDVAELNANLRALGDGSGLGGDAFTSQTASAIDTFQARNGLSQTGELALGSVVFEPGAVRVTTVTPTVGTTVQPGPALGITSLARQVTIALDAAQQSDLKVGDPVTITLPDNSTTPGRVSYVGTVATVPAGSGQGGGGSGTPTIEVDVTPTDPAATGRLDQAPVNVSITTGSVNNALVAPVNALLALASGGYAVEVVRPGGVHQLVGVQVGLFDDADGLVQLTGTDLTPGTRVVVPSG